MTLEGEGIREERSIPLAAGGHRRIEDVNLFFDQERLEAFSLRFGWSSISTFGAATTTDLRSGDVVHSSPKRALDGVIDGVASTVGSGGRSYRTGLVAANLVSAAYTRRATLRFDFVPRGASEAVDSRTIELAPGEVREWADVLPDLFGRTDDAGSLRIDVLDGDAGIAGESWFESERGRFHQRLPFLSDYGGGRATLPGVRQDEHFRTNLFLLGSRFSAAGYRIRVWSPDGTLLGERDGTLSMGESQFFECVLERMGIPELVDGTIEVRAEPYGGRINAWASVVDERSGDGRTVLAR